MAQEIYKVAEIPKKILWKQNPWVCGAVNGEPRMGEGILYYCVLFLVLYLFLYHLCKTNLSLLPFLFSIHSSVLSTWNHYKFFLNHSPLFLLDLQAGLHNSHIFPWGFNFPFLYFLNPSSSPYWPLWYVHIQGTYFSFPYFLFLYLIFCHHTFQQFFHKSQCVCVCVCVCVRSGWEKRMCIARMPLVQSVLVQGREKGYV